MTVRSVSSRLLVPMATGLVLAATPLAIQLTPEGFALVASHAVAKDGGDDHGGGRGESDGDHGGNSGSGGGGANGGGDDHGGGGGHGDDGASDDHGGGGGHGGDGASDDHGGGSGNGGSNDDGHGDSARGGDDDRGTDAAPGGIEVVKADGSKEEIRNGQFERTDAAGRTIEERPATRADLARLTSAAAGGRRTISVGHVSKVEGAGGNLEVRYSTGWKEELQNGRYELKDPDGNTVVERAARPADIARLQQLAGR